MSNTLDIVDNNEWSRYFDSEDGMIIKRIKLYK